MKIAFYAFGCRLNYAELEEVKEASVKMGTRVVTPELADIIVIASCSVTKKAESQTKQKIRSLAKNGAKIIVIGCLKDKMPEIFSIAKNTKDAVGKIKALMAKGTFDRIVKGALCHTRERTRAFIKTQTSCPFKCAFCVSKVLRKSEETVPPEKIIQRIKQAEKDGYKEIVLTGLNILSYKFGKTDTTELVSQILNKTKIERIRFGSIDPRLVNTKFIQLFKNERLCPHLHISMQSGSAEILKKMGRKYNASDILKIVKDFRAINPLFTFTADIIVGFPSETEKDFRATCNLIKKIKLLKAHIFPFSPREDTKSFDSKLISKNIIKKRIEILNSIARQSSADWIKNFKGLTRPVLFEFKKAGFWHGYAPEFIRIKKKSKENLKNKIIDVKI